MLAHEQLKREMLSNLEVKAQYEAFEEEFNFFDGLLRARKNAGLTQSEVAEVMGTTPRFDNHFICISHA